jgi:hypothetical protein
VVVVHLGAPEAACLSQVTSSGASELVVGIETDGRNASN